MKDTDKFAGALLGWIKDMLSHLGISNAALDKMDELIYLVLIIILAIGIGKLVHIVVLYFMRKLLKYKNIQIISTFIEYNTLKKLAWLIPPLIVGALLPFAFEGNARWLDITEKITWIYFVVVLIISANGILSSIGKVLLNKKELHDKPMKGFIQILQVLISFIAFIVIVSILVDKSPWNLITGLGAFAAVLMLIFKDTILGFVASVLLSQNDMIHIGDWIEMPTNAVNGVVIDISLNVVKVQNFDNTIVTIPPYSLISGSFINWRGMAESGGRRIMRSYEVSLDGVQACTPEFLEEMKGKFELLKEYITKKQAEQAAGKVANTDNPEGLVNGTIETNAGLFRAYMTLYLQHHPFINQQLLLMVRTLAPTDNGLPIQIYCFSANKNWPSYESIQAEIMEHFVSVLPEFGLYAFQNPTARDYINSSILEAGKGADALYGIPWHTFRPGVSAKPAKPATPQAAVTATSASVSTSTSAEASSTPGASATPRATVTSEASPKTSSASSSEVSSGTSAATSSEKPSDTSADTSASSGTSPRTSSEEKKS